MDGQELADNIDLEVADEIFGIQGRRVVIAIYSWIRRDRFSRMHRDSGYVPSAGRTSIVQQVVDVIGKLLHFLSAGFDALSICDVQG